MSSHPPNKKSIHVNLITEIIWKNCEKKLNKLLFGRCKKNGGVLGVSQKMRQNKMECHKKARKLRLVYLKKGAKINYVEAYNLDVEKYVAIAFFQGAFLDAPFNS